MPLFRPRAPAWFAGSGPLIGSSTAEAADVWSRAGSVSRSWCSRRWDDAAAGIAGRRSATCPEGENFVVVPANGGSRRVPAWLNLSAAGEGIAVVGNLRRRVRPVLADGERREQLRGRLLVAYPGLEAYLARARRNVPIVALEPV
jgi:hypothetical protein